MSGERHSVIRLQGPSSSLGPMPLPKFEHHDARHKPTLIEPARSQMTASSPRGTFSQAELTAERVITRCITRCALRPELSTHANKAAAKGRCSTLGWLGKATITAPDRVTPHLAADCCSHGAPTSGYGQLWR